MSSRGFLAAVTGQPGTTEKPACVSEEPELFFPSYALGGEGEFQVRQAKKVCARCPLINACLEFALETGDRWAILGGMTPGERESIRRNKGQQWAA